MCAGEGDEGMKPPGTLKSSPPPFAGLQASQGSSARDEGARRVKKKRVLTHGDAGVMAELWQSHRLLRLSTATLDLASRKLFPFKSKPGATLSPCWEAEHEWGGEPVVGLNRNPTNTQGLSPAALGEGAWGPARPAAPSSHPGERFP